MINTNTPRISAVSALSLLTLLMLISHTISSQDFSLFKLCIAAIAGLGINNTWQQHMHDTATHSTPRPINSPAYRWHCRDCDHANKASLNQCAECGLLRNQKALLSAAQKPLANP